MKTVIWGAGREGRGFLAEIFRHAGDIAFVDAAGDVVDALNSRGEYRLLQRPPAAPPREDVVRGFSAHRVDDAETASLIAQADVVALCVYMEKLPEAAAALAAALERRRERNPDRPVDVLLCINAIHYEPTMRTLFRRHMSPALAAWFDCTVGIVETLVRRTCVAPPSGEAKSPLDVMTNLFPTLLVDADACRTNLASLPFIEPARDMRMEERRKIYTYNLMHACYAYYGRPLGYALINQSRDNPQIQAVAQRAYEESARALCAEYSIPDADMRSFGETMRQYVVNPAMPDQVDRAGVDPARKLSRDERIIGPARLCVRHGIAPAAICAIAAQAFRYDNPGDPSSRRLQRDLAALGLPRCIEKYCGIGADGEIARLIIASHGQG